MLRGEVVALLLSALLALVFAAERSAKLRTHEYAPLAAALLPVLAVVLGSACAAQWFTTVLEIRSPSMVRTLLVAAALALPVALCRGRARRIVAGVTIALLSVLALADALYYRFFGTILPLLGASNMKQAWDLGASIVALLLPRDWVFVVLFLGGVWLAASRPGLSGASSDRWTRIGLRAAIALCVLGVLVVAADLRYWFTDRSSKSIHSWRERLQEVGVFGSHLRDVTRRMRESGSAPPSPDEIRSLEKYLDAKQSPVQDEFFGLARGKSLLLVQIEALQEWVIGARVRGIEITPFLNRLVRERAFYFSGIWDQTAVSSTADSEFITLNSLHPFPDGAVVFRYAGNDFVAMPRVMARAGYTTLSLHAFDRSFWNRAVVHPRYGFQSSYFDNQLGKAPKMGWGLPDKVFFARALERIDHAPAPFFAFLITLTTHHPYSFIPPEERHVDTAGLPEIVAGYVQSMRYVDEAIAELFAALEKRAYSKNTVVALYGDHEARILLDPPAEERVRSLLSLDAHTLSDLARRSFATRKIPLLVVMPDSKEPRTFGTVGGQIDTAPTLLHLFGLKEPKVMMGRPLFGEGGMVVRYDGSAVEGERLRLADGSCRTLGGKDLPPAECQAMGKRAEDDLRVSWTIVRHDLAERLSGALHAVR
jgi:phosphoglycerol transferase MdoB-like AlkP superfamily enzyme